MQILAFPCNQFGNQEPGDGASIKEFAQKRCGAALARAQSVDITGLLLEIIMRTSLLVSYSYCSLQPARSLAARRALSAPSSATGSAFCV